MCSPMRTKRYNNYWNYIFFMLPAFLSTAIHKWIALVAAISHKPTWASSVPFPLQPLTERIVMKCRRKCTQQTHLLNSRTLRKMLKFSFRGKIYHNWQTVMALALKWPRNPHASQQNIIIHSPTLLENGPFSPTLLTRTVKLCVTMV